MIEEVTTPRVGARIRWQTPAGTYFGHVTEVDTETSVLTVRIEDTNLVTTVEAGRSVLLSNPRG